MDWWLLTFFLGAILSLFLPIVPVLFQLFLLLLLASLFFYLKSLRASSGLLFGMLWMLVNAYSYHQQASDELIALMQNKQTINIVGEVHSLTTLNAKKSESIKFNVEVNKINQQTLTTPLLIRLSWKKSPFTLEQGQLLTLAVKLKPAHGLANLGGFNYQAWLKSRNIVATGYVINDKKRSNKNRLLRHSTSLRQTLFNQYQQLLLKGNGAENVLSPLMFALAFGERSQLTPEHWKVLQATGTGHLIAISGLHVGLLASGSFFAVIVLFRLLPLQLFPRIANTLQRGNNRYFAILFSIVIALFYGFLAGFSLPTQRALVMLLLYWLTRLFAIKLSIKRWLLLTLFILLLLSPFSLFTASFWLSVYAVTIIFMTLWRFQVYLRRGNTLVRFLKGLLIIQLSLTLMLLPISAFFFQKLSIVALFANLLAVPWMSFISIPCALLSVIVMPLSEHAAQFFLQTSLESMTLVWRYLDFLAALSFAQQTVSKGQLFIIFTVTCGLFYKVFLSKRLSINNASAFVLIGSCLFFVLVLNRQYILQPASAQQYPFQQTTPWNLQLFDVGQGLSVLISRDDKALLYDTGAAYPSGFNMIDAVVLPYLHYSGFEQLDKVFISHSDNDHAGGLTPLLAGIAVKQLITNDSKIAKMHKRTIQCRKGTKFHWQGLTISVLWPPEPRVNTQLLTKPVFIKQKNDDSCILLISDGKYNVLLTGDISKKVELQLLLLYPKLTVDVLLVPHHGSKTSSSAAFLKQLSPKVALVSAGFLNRWHMPVNQVVTRYQQQGIKLINSSEKGQVVLTFSDNITIENYHDDLRPFWFSH